MLKNILNLEGAQELTKNEQKSINGGVTKACADALANGICASKVSLGGTCPPGTEGGAPCNSVAFCCGL